MILVNEPQYLHSYQVSKNPEAWNKYKDDPEIAGYFMKMMGMCAPETPNPQTPNRARNPPPLIPKPWGWSASNEGGLGVGGLGVRESSLE